MHPTKRQVRRLVELNGEMSVADIAARIGISARQTRSVVGDMVRRHYLIERREPAPGAVCGVTRLMVRSSGVELPADPSCRDMDDDADGAFPGDWWPKADAIVEAAMRGMVSVGRAAL